MVDWLEWFLESEKLPVKIVRALHYLYRTHLSLPWLVTYAVLLWAAWDRLSIRALVVFGNVGLILLGFTIASLATEARVFHAARNAFHDFADAFSSDRPPSGVTPSGSSTVWGAIRH